MKRFPQISPSQGFLNVFNLIHLIGKRCKYHFTEPDLDFKIQKLKGKKIALCMCMCIAFLVSSSVPAFLSPYFEECLPARQKQVSRPVWGVCPFLSAWCLQIMQAEMLFHWKQSPKTLKFGNKVPPLGKELILKLGWKHTTLDCWSLPKSVCHSNQVTLAQVELLPLSTC